LAKAGFIISCATVTYPALSLLDEADQRSQIEQNRAAWEQLIGERIKHSLILSAAFTMIGLPKSVSLASPAPVRPCQKGTLCEAIPCSFPASKSESGREIIWHLRSGRPSGSGFKDEGRDKDDQSTRMSEELVDHRVRREGK